MIPDVLLILSYHFSVNGPFNLSVYRFVPGHAFPVRSGESGPARPQSLPIEKSRTPPHSKEVRGCVPYSGRAVIACPDFDLAILGHCHMVLPQFALPY